MHTRISRWPRGTSVRDARSDYDDSSAVSTGQQDTGPFEPNRVRLRANQLSTYEDQPRRSRTTMPGTCPTGPRRDVRPRSERQILRRPLHGRRPRPSRDLIGERRAQATKGVLVPSSQRRRIRIKKRAKHTIGHHTGRGNIWATTDRDRGTALAPHPQSSNHANNQVPSRRLASCVVLRLRSSAGLVPSCPIRWVQPDILERPSATACRDSHRAPQAIRHQVRDRIT